MEITMQIGGYNYYLEYDSTPTMLSSPLDLPTLSVYKLTDGPKHYINSECIELNTSDDSIIKCLKTLTDDLLHSINKCINFINSKVDAEFIKNSFIMSRAISDEIEAHIYTTLGSIDLSDSLKTIIDSVNAELERGEIEKCLAANKFMDDNPPDSSRRL